LWKLSSKLHSHNEAIGTRIRRRYFPVACRQARVTSSTNASSSCWRRRARAPTLGRPVTGAAGGVRRRSRAPAGACAQPDHNLASLTAIVTRAPLRVALGGGGTDLLDAINKPAHRDIVNSGGGFDYVFADTKDVVAPDCEKVAVGAATGDLFESLSRPGGFFDNLFGGLAPFPGG
jgi:hypothetical protein